jgi:aryl-alcohol dehydrogenase-like predicted oxidoreductase
MGEEAGVTDRDRLTRASLKWNLSIDGMTTVLVGADHSAHLLNSLSVLDNPSLQANEIALLEQVKSSPTYIRVSAEKEARFFGLN